MKKNYPLLFACVFTVSVSAQKISLVKENLYTEMQYLKEKVVSGNHLFFTTYGKISGRSAVEFFVTDGTSAGTFKLEINSAGNDDASGLYGFAGNAFFAANDGVNGKELWVSDGTKNGTYLVEDINPTGSSNPYNFLTYNDKLYFLAFDGTQLNLYKTDSAANSVTVTNITVPVGLSAISEFTVYNGKFYFAADDGINGTELWELDINTNVIQLFKDINPTGDSKPSTFNLLDGKLVFLADDGQHGTELWVSDGTLPGTYLLKNIVPDSLGFQLAHIDITYFKDKLYFIGHIIYKLHVHGKVYTYGLGYTDATTQGTNLYKSIINVLPNVPSLLEYNGRLFFSLGTEEYGVEPWVTDGTAGGTKLWKDIMIPLDPTRLGSMPENYTAFNDYLFLSANNGPTIAHGIHMFVTNGNPENLMKIMPEIAPYPYPSPSDYVVVNNALLFMAQYRYGKGRELWKVTYPVGLAEYKNDLISQIYPNPTNGEVNIKLQANIPKEAKIALIDITGQLLQEWETDHLGMDQNLDISSYPPGIYLLELVTKTGIDQKKIILQ